MGKMIDSTRKVPVAGSAISKTSAPTGATSTRSSKKLKSRQNSVKSINHYKTINYPERMSVMQSTGGGAGNSTQARRKMAH